MNVTDKKNGIHGLPDTSTIEELEQQISQDRKHYNNVRHLLQYASSQDQQHASDAQLALCRVFSRLLSEGALSGSKGSTENQRIVIQWLVRQYSEYWEMLLSGLQTLHTKNQKLYLKLLMQLFKEEQRSRKGTTTADERLSTILWALVNPATTQDLRMFFIGAFAGKYKDVLAITFRNIPYVTVSSMHGGS